MQPIVNGLEAEFRNQMAFERFDANRLDGESVMNAYSIRGHPSYLIVDPDGTLLWSFTGAVSANTLRQQIAVTLDGTD